MVLCARSVVGSIVGVVLSVGLGAAMLPLRAHLSIATAALVFVLPVVAGVITGGFRAGVASVVPPDSSSTTTASSRPTTGCAWGAPRTGWP